MPTIAKDYSKLKMIAATILLSPNTAIADGFSTPVTRDQFQTPFYNQICPLAVYNEDYRDVQDSELLNATAGKPETLKRNPPKPVEKSKG